MRSTLLFPMTDRSAIGIYFADARAAEVRAIVLGGESAGAGDAGSDRVSFTRTIDADLRALAIYPDPALAHARVRVEALRPDGSREELIVFRAQPNWARRYWFQQPIALPRGTRIAVTATFNDEAALLPPGATPPPRVEPDASKVRLTLNVL